MKVRVTKKLAVVLLFVVMLSGSFVFLVENASNGTHSFSKDVNAEKIPNLSFSQTFKIRKIGLQDIKKMESMVREKSNDNRNQTVMNFTALNFHKNDVKVLSDPHGYRLQYNSSNGSYPIIDGHATGLKLPSKEDLKKFIGQKMIVGVRERISGRGSVRWDLDPHFPPVGDQGEQGSCTAWAVSYYQNGFLQRRIYNWTDDSPTHLMSPAWTYNKVNGGYDGGSTFEGNIEIIQDVGDATLSNMSYDPDDYISWGNESAWRDAPKHRIADYYTVYFGNDSGIETLKTLLQEGYLITFGIDAWQFGNGFSDGNYIISSEEYNSNHMNHAQTIVGYDDSITDDGDVGAFRVVNSWGSDWGDHGFYWITYKALEDKVSQGWPYAYVLVPISDKPYNPKLLATWKFSHPGPRDESINITLGSENSTNYRKMFLDGGNYSFPEFMAVDITEFYNEWKNSSYQYRFYLKIGTENSGSGSSVVSSLRIEYYPYGYKFLWQESPESPDVPATTPAVLESGKLIPGEYYPYLYIKLENGIIHRYPDRNNVSIIVGNAGNKTDAIMLSASATNGWNVSVPEKIVLAPGTTVSVNLSLDTPQNVELGDSSVINVTGISENDTSKVYEISFQAYYTSRPIYINGDDDLRAQVERYGWPGDGTKDNPYVISNLFIYKEEDDGINILNTKSYIKIENSVMEYVKNGVYISHSKNIDITNITVEFSKKNGVTLVTSHNIRLLNNKLTHNIVGYGIGDYMDEYELESTNITIKNNNCSYNGGGIADTSSYSLIQNNTIFNNKGSGIAVSGNIIPFDSGHNPIINNKIINNGGDGIVRFGFSNEIIRDNVILNSGANGIYIIAGSNNLIANNVINSSKGYDIGIDGSEATLWNNKMGSGGIFLWAGSRDDKYMYGSQTISKNNTVNGKPVYYYNNGNMHNSTVEPKNAGEIIVGNVSYLKIRNITIENVSIGIIIGCSSHISLFNVSVKYANWVGVDVELSRDISIRNSVFEHTGYGGVYSLVASIYIYIENNKFSFNFYGGVVLDLSYSIIKNNIFRNNTIDGASIEGSFNLIRNNIFINNGFNNLTWVCPRHDDGLFVWGSFNSIVNNSIQNNFRGIALVNSGGNVIYNNKIVNNSGYGLRIYESSKNKIYGNIFSHNLVGNTYNSYLPTQALDEGSDNYWNSTTGYGNYWNDWANNNDTNDQNHDGIVDWPYKIDGGQ